MPVAILTALAILLLIVSHACAKFYGETDEPVAYAIGTACAVGGVIAAFFAGYMA